MIAPVTESPAKATLDAVKRKLGVVPNMMRLLATSPAILDACLAFSDAVTRAGLGTKANEQIALAVAADMDIDFPRAGRLPQAA
jgi:hypothetical protein